MGVTIVETPDCGVPAAEKGEDCLPMLLRCPGYCDMCERNPANREG
jgi:hypothetical protein